MNSKTTGQLTEEKSIENYWYRESASGSGNPWAANCGKLGKYYSCNFPSSLWLTSLGDRICMRMTVGLTDYNCTYILILCSYVSWEKWIHDAGNVGVLQHHLENCPQQSVSPWQICRCLLRLSLLPSPRTGNGTEPSTCWAKQVHDRAGPQDGTNMYHRVGKKWKKTGFSFWYSAPNSCSKKFTWRIFAEKAPGI